LTAFAVPILDRNTVRVATTTSGLSPNIYETAGYKALWETRTSPSWDATCAADPGACWYWWGEFGDQVELWAYVSEMLAEFSNP
jgi:hypothetical protein